MSIFKDTLSQYVQDQLKAREIIVSQASGSNNTVSAYGSVPRSDAFLKYTTGKNSWVKMQSFVDVSNLKIGSKTYNGSELARKYILEGGTLYEIQPGEYALRQGVSLKEGVYASDIDLGGNRPLGLRPMPGISSVQINNKSAYGSLREATIKFYCWDKHQLEELEVLYMRTGYSVLLEWGWSQYLQSGKVSKDANGKNVYNNTLNNISIQNFDYPTIDIFYDNNILNPGGSETSDEIIYKTIEDLNIKSSGNYDAMLGHIKNFSWQLMPNGGFECTTVLISRGEVISTLKLNNNNSALVLNDNIDPNAPTPPLSQFENIFLNYTALINNSELTSKWQSGRSIGQFATGSSPITSTTANKLKDDINTKLGPGPSSKRVPLPTDGGDLFNQQMVTDLNSYYGITLLTAGQENGVGIEYIKMDHLIALLNLYYNYKDKNNRIVSSILIPKNNLCLASTDSVSVDPTTCLIFNSQAEEITALQPNGFTPEAFISVVAKPAPREKDVDVVPISNPPQFLTGSGRNKRGKINNIYVAIPKILSIYREISRNGDVNLIDFLKKLLNQISVALGNINDFSLHTNKSSAQIIDIKYLEQGNSTKYEFDLLGLKSVCRDVRITSRIFESQASMIAIAAQSKTNVGDLYTSTQVHFNKGLKDRILTEKDIYNDGNNNTPSKFYESIYKNIITISNYLKIKVIGDIINIGGATDDRRGIIYPSSTEISNASSLLKTFHYQLRGDETSFKAIIPLELEITLDGIAGLVQGQIFRVNSNILPSMYDQQNLGFIITGISHSLQNNDWITTIKTQICLLDNDKIPFSGVDFPKLRKILRGLLTQGKKNQYLILAITDYLSLVILNSVDGLFGSGIDKANSFSYTQAQLQNLSDDDKREQIYKAINGGYSKPLGFVSSIKFNDFLTEWYKSQINKPNLNTPAKRANINFPENINELKTFDLGGGGSTIFDPSVVDVLLNNTTGAESDKLNNNNPDSNTKFISLLYLQPYLYGFFGRGLNYKSTIQNIIRTPNPPANPTLVRPPETNNAILINPTLVENYSELDTIMLAMFNIFDRKIQPNNSSKYTRAKYQNDVNLLLNKRIMINGPITGGINTYKINPDGLYDYIFEYLVNNIFGSSNSSLPTAYIAHIATLRDYKSKIDVITGDSTYNNAGVNGINTIVNVY